MKSQLMKNAHKLAKTFEGNYSACLKLAMIILWKKLKEGKDLNKVVTGMTKKKAPKKEKTVEEVRTEMLKSIPYLADDNGLYCIDQILYRVEDSINIAYEEDGYEDNFDSVAEFKKAIKEAQKFLKKYSKYKGLDKED